MNENYDSDENVNEIDNDEIELDDDDLDEDLEDSESMLEPQVNIKYIKIFALHIFLEYMNLTQNIRNHWNLVHVYLVISSYK